MTVFHEIWIEQCEAALTIRARFGLPEALGHLVVVRAAKDVVRLGRMRELWLGPADTPG